MEGIGVISTSKDGRLERGDLNRQPLKRFFSREQQGRWEYTTTTTNPQVALDLFFFYGQCNVHFILAVSNF